MVEATASSLFLHSHYSILFRGLSVDDGVLLVTVPKPITINSLRGGYDVDRVSILRAGVREVTEFQGILNMSCFEEYMIRLHEAPPYSLHRHRSNAKRVTVDLDARDDSVASTRGFNDRMSFGRAD